MDGSLLPNDRLHKIIYTPAPHIVFNVGGFAYVAQTAPVRLLLGYCEGQAAVDYIAAVQIPFLYIFAARLVSLKKDGLAG